jgi:23S rRNA (uracil1939-C5)-methyltransferase
MRPAGAHGSGRPPARRAPRDVVHIPDEPSVTAAGLAEPAVEGGCRFATRCGGCGWQHVAYVEQLRRKQATVREELRQALGAAAPDVAPVLSATSDATDGSIRPAGFRRKVHFVFGPAEEGRSLALGHFGRGTQRFVPVDACEVHAVDGNALAFAIRDACARLDLPFATADGRRGLLRHLVIRTAKGSGERLATLVVTDATDRRLRRLSTVVMTGAERPDGWFVNELRGPSSWLFGPETRRLAGRPWAREEIAGVSYLVGPTAFFQTNVEAAERLVTLVLHAIPQTIERVIDLYAGVGLFALPLARRGQAVAAVEEDRTAIEAARRSQRLNGIDERRCQLVAARVEDALDRLTARGRERSRGGTAVVLDPPRTGCAPAVLQRLAEGVRPEVIAYVSCEPASLARDLALFRGLCRAEQIAYHIDAVQPVDMFPHTAHVECVAVLRRADGTRDVDTRARGRRAAAAPAGAARG